MSSAKPLLLFPARHCERAATRVGGSGRRAAGGESRDDTAGTGRGFRAADGRARRGDGDDRGHACGSEGAPRARARSTVRGDARRGWRYPIDPPDPIQGRAPAPFPRTRAVVEKCGESARSESVRARGFGSRRDAVQLGGASGEAEGRRRQGPSRQGRWWRRRSKGRAPPREISIEGGGLGRWRWPAAKRREDDDRREGGDAVAKAGGKTEKRKKVERAEGYGNGGGLTDAPRRRDAEPAPSIDARGGLLDDVSKLADERIDVLRGSSEIGRIESRDGTDAHLERVYVSVEAARLVAVSNLCFHFEKLAAPVLKRRWANTFEEFMLCHAGGRDPLLPEDHEARDFLLDRLRAAGDTRRRAKNHRASREPLQRGRAESRAPAPPRDATETPRRHPRTIRG